MIKPIINTICVIIICLTTTIVRAGGTDNHQVTVVVNPINEIAVTGGNITLTINSATAGLEPNTVRDYTTCDLIWTTNESNKKITVSTSLASPKFSLAISARELVGGSLIRKVQLSTVPQDFITNISNTTGSCDLYYAAWATSAQGYGTDDHTMVTFTLTDN